jgi:hypothetical protein
MSDQILEVKGMHGLSFISHLSTLISHLSHLRFGLSRPFPLFGNHFLKRYTLKICNYLIVKFTPETFGRAESIPVAGKVRRDAIDHTNYWLDGLLNIEHGDLGRRAL